jgi:hypothetical protein
MIQRRKGNKASRRNGGPPRTIGGAGDQIVKRMSFTGTTSTLTTGAGTAIGITSIPSDPSGSGPGAAFEWSSFSQRYQQYRVRKMRITGKALLPVQNTTQTHSILIRADYIGTSGPATVPQVLADEKAKFVATCQDFVDVVTWARNPNAKLWNPTSASPPSANLFNWVCASFAANAMATATKYYQLVIEWEVEFRGAQ